MNKQSAKKYWSAVEFIVVDNEKFDNGTYFKELDNFFDKFFTQGWDDDTPIEYMVLRENKTLEQFNSEQFKYLESKGVIIVIKNDKDKN